MTDGEWTRRDVIRGLAAAVLLAAGTGTARAGSSAGSGPRDREARRRWALAQMDEMARERLRCSERFRSPKEIRDCQVVFEQRHRAYNEIYIEAARE
jgi:hypothetical protein